MAVEDWGWSYSLSLDTDRRAVDPYPEFRHLQIRGRLLHPRASRPTRLRSRCCRPTICCRRQGKSGSHAAWGPLNIYDNRMAGLVPIPMDALPPVLQMLIGGRFRFVSMRGPQFRYRKTLCSSFRLEMTMNEDDLPHSGGARELTMRSPFADTRY